MSLNVKISQLLPAPGGVQSQDEFPVSRAGLETYKLNAGQFVINGGNIGSGEAIFYDRITGNGATLRFRRLTGIDGVRVTTSENAETLVISASAQNFQKTTLTGDGFTRIFSVNGGFSTNPNTYRVDIDGVLQEPGVNYNIDSSKRLEFVTAPPNGSKIVVLATTFLSINEYVPDNSSVTPEKLSQGGPYWSTTGSVGIKTVAPNRDLTVVGSISATNQVQSGSLITGQIQCTTINLSNLPTSSIGLPSGSVWRDVAAGNVLKIVP